MVRLVHGARLGRVPSAARWRASKRHRRSSKSFAVVSTHVASCWRRSASSSSDCRNRWERLDTCDRTPHWSNRSSLCGRRARLLACGLEPWDGRGPRVVAQSDRKVRAVVDHRHQRPATIKSRSTKTPEGEPYVIPIPRCAGQSSRLRHRRDVREPRRQVYDGRGVVAVFSHQRAAGERLMRAQYTVRYRRR